jgi:structural maintenance of chromosome 2
LVWTGGRIYNVIIDTEETGKLLLNKGNLTKRITFVPLSKIQGYEIDDKTIRIAEEQVGKNKVWKCLDLIRYAPELAPAMTFFYGSQLICENMDVAKKIAYHPKIQRRYFCLFPFSVVHD